MFQRYRGPGAYRQGEEALATADTEFADFDAVDALLIGGETALSVAQAPLVDAIERAGLAHRDTVQGVVRCSRETVSACIDRGAPDGETVVVGVGGGHALDAATVTAIELGAPLVTVPTVASTDAPCSAIAALYDDETGAYEGVVHRDRNPELVVVDTGLMAAAPPRFLRYGMADALATHFEAQAVARNPSAETVAGGRPSDTALALAARCYDNVRADGTAALAAAERDAVTPALETIVETNTLLSGIGFECGGLAAAHAYQEGFTRAGVDAPHGIAVGIGLLAQLVLEGRDEEFDEVLSLYFDLGIDTTLAEVDVDEDRADDIAAHACDSDTPMANEPVTVTDERARDALLVADERIEERR
ncbi:iron-containing alcohol dehydrogenase [Halobellus rufus]|uniref:iron-containing alcohol dehydrogenase n=1 Tax=Halobellus rufus TaxID=1448860 RepID=UPI0006789DD6|nr:iron-containing alcohol dehydrogenase [Halobellus rufus]